MQHSFPSACGSVVQTDGGDAGCSGTGAGTAELFVAWHGRKRFFFGSDHLTGAPKNYHRSVGSYGPGGRWPLCV